MTIQGPPSAARSHGAPVRGLSLVGAFPPGEVAVDPRLFAGGIPTGAGVPFAMARDGRFFAALGAVSPPTRVPVKALAAQCVWVCMLVLSGSFDALTDYAMFAAWIFHAFAVSSVLVLGRPAPDGPRGPAARWFLGCSRS